ncbi:MAG: hypothetical protein ACOX86_09585 [Pelotomaculaceae bacterium]|uniref:Uncharacterized protein n=1 Tax=anaerobic digester metagenome TaxID=1263854 RepID=A0A485M0Q2_9ZZZZ|nr:hypothetical protein [Bacillota bacterium]HHU85915.1 hypothetical protein [Peptococcaceae bacterium]
MNEYKPQKPHILFRTPEQLQRYLEGAGSAELRFRAYPISGEPETYNYSSGEKTVTRETDGMSFDSLDDFTCYAFQYDPEGYPSTEHVYLEVLN